MLSGAEIFTSHTLILLPLVLSFLPSKFKPIVVCCPRILRAGRQKETDSCTLLLVLDKAPPAVGCLDTEAGTWK
uniref:Secreted protein n=1 Tax=Arundo donax TaxID=35708 RepID=A0A0A9B6Y1_ARUDO